MKISPPIRLDDFLRSLQREVGESQRAVKQRQESLVRRYFDVEADGELKAVKWAVNVPGQTFRQDGLEERIEVPLLSLLPPSQQKIVEVSLEFEADMEESRKDSRDGRGRLVLVLRKRKKWKKTNGRRIRIALLGPQPGKLEVYVDGVLFKTLEGAEVHTEPSPNPSLFDT